MQQKNQELKGWIKNGGIVIPFIFLIIVLILNINMRGNLFLLGVDGIYDIQANKDQIYNIFQNVVSLLANHIIIIPILALQYLLCQRKILVFVNLIYFMGGLYFMALFKQIYQQIRPFWFDGTITILDWFCPTDFGHPSGHSFGIVVLYEPLFSDFLGAGAKKFFIFIWTVVVALVMFSRMYLGDHSLDQVLFGAFLGLFFLVLYRFKLQQSLYEIAANLINQKYKALYFICNTIICILFFAIPIANYQLNVANRPIDQIYLDSINQACNKSVTEAILKQKSLKTTIDGFFAIGIIYGFILLKNVEQKDTYYMVGLWKFANVKSAILFLIGLIVVAIPAVLLIYVVPFVIKQAIVNFVSMSFGAIWTGIGLVYIIPSLQNKFEWIVYTHNALVS